jgi:predicted DNA-binding transcriptional regulator YafY
LSLGLRLLTQQAAGSLTRSAESSLAKINVVLPEQVRMKSEALTNIIEFIAPTQKFDLDDPQLLIIQKAIQEKRVIHIRYHGYQKDEVTERDVEPYQLFYSDGIWYLEGYCRMRKDIRDFRLSRIEKMVALKETFIKRRAGKSGEQKKIAVKIRFTKRIARWVRERQHYGFQNEEDLPDGVVMRYAVHDVSEITAWIQGWGAAAELLSPKELRNSLRQTAQKLADLLT